MVAGVAGADVGEVDDNRPLLPRHITNVSMYPRFKFRTGEYDLVIMINVLEHCMDALKVLQNAHNAVKEGGYLVLQDRFADDLWSIFVNDVSARSPDPNPELVSKW